MQRYAQSHGTDLSINQLMQHLKWLDPERDTNLVRSLVSNLLISGSQVSCVWSGKKLKADKFDIDHCFPFSAWPCNDLWNLVPATREINNKKTDKLVTLSTLNEARARIETWWDSAYFAASLLYEGRFRREAFASLPLFEAGSESRFFDEMFEALSLKRASLKQNLNLEDWEMM